MFSWLSRMFDKVDDRFVKTAFDPNARQAFMQPLKQIRLLMSILVIANVGIIIFEISIFGLNLMGISILISVVMILFEVILAIMADYQIKMLLLFEKTQSKE